MTHIEPAIPLPTAFAIPCARYVDFMQQTGLSAQVDALLADPALARDGRQREAALAALRDAIEAAPVDPALLSQIEERARSLFGQVPTRLRSSSNAEDLAEFNGAGLYDSATWNPADPEKPLARALKHVWASLWSFAAFEERDWARVDHRACAMGVLVHPSFPDAIEAANGVAITANPFDPPPDGQAAYYLNTQAGATPVTNPLPGNVPESLLCRRATAGSTPICASRGNGSATEARAQRRDHVNVYLQLCAIRPDDLGAVQRATKPKQSTSSRATAPVRA